MKVIPVINCQNFDCVKEKISQATDLGATWIHIDIEDGKFLTAQTWNNPQELKEFLLTTHYSLPTTEIHLMVENPEEVLEEWIAVGAKRIFIHSEAISNIDKFIDIVKKNKKTEFGVAIKPETEAKELLLYSKFINLFQILAVNPGPSGQKFNPSILEKIHFLRTNLPNAKNAKIEVDGGINKETAKLIKIAGADIIVSSSYIWNSENPKETYEELRNI